MLQEIGPLAAALKTAGFRVQVRNERTVPPGRRGPDHLSPKPPDTPFDPTLPARAR
jgi:hypothetical protein